MGEFWSARVNDAHRVLAVREGNVSTWFWIGPLDEYERMINGFVERIQPRAQPGPFASLGPLRELSLESARVRPPSSAEKRFDQGDHRSSTAPLGH